jgi:hypothetical protein
MVPQAGGRHQAKVGEHNLGQKKSKRRRKQARALMIMTINRSVSAVPGTGDDNAANGAGMTKQADWGPAL